MLKVGQGYVRTSIIYAEVVLMKTIPNDQFLAIVRKRAATLAVKRRQGIVSCDDLRAYCANQQIQPESDNVWGHVFRTDQWHPAGFRTSITPSRRGGTQREWMYILGGKR
jgi:hypothetical protein